MSTTKNNLMIMYRLIFNILCFASTQNMEMQQFIIECNFYMWWYWYFYMWWYWLILRYRRYTILWAEMIKYYGKILISRMHISYLTKCRCCRIWRIQFYFWNVNCQFGSTTFWWQSAFCLLWAINAQRNYCFFCHCKTCNS